MGKKRKSARQQLETPLLQPDSLDDELANVSGDAQATTRAPQETSNTMRSAYGEHIGFHGEGGRAQHGRAAEAAPGVAAAAGGLAAGHEDLPSRLRSSDLDHTAQQRLLTRDSIDTARNGTRWAGRQDPHGIEGAEQAGRCFSIFTEASRWRYRVTSAAMGARESCAEAVMFPARARWGTVSSSALKAFDLSWGKVDERRLQGDSSESSRTSWQHSVTERIHNMPVGAARRMTAALREALRGVHFRYRVAMALGLHQNADDDYSRYFSKKFRESGNAGGQLIVCLPMRISEIHANGTTRERTDLNQLDLLRACFQHMNNPPLQLVALLQTPDVADLSRSGASGKDSISCSRQHSDAGSVHQEMESAWSGNGEEQSRRRNAFFRPACLGLGAGESGEGQGAAGQWRGLADDQAAKIDGLGLKRLSLGDFLALQPLGEARVLVRQGAVVVGLDPLRCVLMRDRIYVVVPPGDENVLSQLHNCLSTSGAFNGNGATAQGRQMAFQEVALGAVLQTVLDFYVEQVQLLAYTSVSVWAAVRGRVSSAEINRLQLLRVRLFDMLQQVEGVQGVMDSLHSQVDDLELTGLCESPDNAMEDRRGDGVGLRKVVWLLEEHMGEIGVLRNYLTNILQEIDDLRVLLQFHLLCSQNKLLRAEVGFQVGTAWACAGGLVGAIFGMNLHSGLESLVAGPFALANWADWNSSDAARWVWLGYMDSGQVSQGQRVGQHALVSWAWLEVVVGTIVGVVTGAVLTTLLLFRLGVFVR